MEGKQIEENTTTEEKRKWCVYMHRNIINNKVYIGITSKKPEKRWGKNGSRYTKKDQYVFSCAIKKYGWDNFEHIILAEELSEKDAKELEIILIDLFKSNCCRYKNPSFGYNMTDGGDGACGHKFTDEAKIKMGVSQKNRFKDPKNHPMFGVHRFGEDNPNYGNHKLAGKNNPNYGNRKPVIQLSIYNQLISIFDSADEAYKSTGVFATQIYSVCIHKPHYKTAGGYVWKYLYDYTTKDDTIIPGAITLGIITEREALELLNKQQND